MIKTDFSVSMVGSYATVPVLALHIHPILNTVLCDHDYKLRVKGKHRLWHTKLDRAIPTQGHNFTKSLQELFTLCMNLGCM